MVGPVPGMAPNSVPTKVPRIMGQKASLSSSREGRMSRMLILALVVITLILFTFRMKSATPNRPIATATSSSPSLSSGRPKAKR